MLTNNEQLYQSVWQSVKNLKPLKKSRERGGGGVQFDFPGPLKPDSRVNGGHLLLCVGITTGIGENYVW